MAGEIQLNSVTLATESSGTISLSGNVDTSTSTKTALNASGSAPIYACRAWVNFNGTGTVAIRASGNVSSITDNGTGDYTVNFTTAMPDTNFCVVYGGLSQSGGARNYSVGIGSVGSFGSSASFPYQIEDSDGSPNDWGLCMASVFR